jgi:single-stranded DNA-binding protein
MTGIQATFEGRIARPAELRRAAGQAVLDVPVLVRDVGTAAPDEAEAVRVTVWGEEAERLHESGALTVGAAVRVTGQLRVQRQPDGGDEPAAGLRVSAWEVGVLHSDRTAGVASPTVT